MHMDKYVPRYVCAADTPRGLDDLRRAVAREILRGTAPRPALGLLAPLLRETLQDRSGSEHRGTDTAPPRSGGDSAQAWSSAASAAERTRVIALVELARGGDAEAFGQLYDHYNGAVYRFLYYRLGSVALAEDLTSETFLRALRSMASFRWQGKDFGAWLMTIARNLTMDHFKSARTRLESASDDLTPYGGEVDGPESAVLETLTNESLFAAIRKLPEVQQECLVLRFLQGLSVAETAEVLGRSEGAVKQLQLRAVRNLAKLLPQESA
jgi:RNA polymerase sigma-70 factor (ECF subfamily)